MYRDAIKVIMERGGNGWEGNGFVFVLLKQEPFKQISFSIHSTGTFNGGGSPSRSCAEWMLAKSSERACTSECYKRRRH